MEKEKIKNIKKRDKWLALMVKINGKEKKLACLNSAVYFNNLAYKS
jgi:hypothetical protein